jgi:surface antigen
VAPAVIVVLACCGCSYQLDSMFSKPDADVAQTGSVARSAAAGGASAAAATEPSPSDLAYARAAAADALARDSKGDSVPWRNPQTGVGGNITPLAATHDENGLPCRDFLASYTQAGTQAWLQGSACRSARGDWEVKSLKPLKSG